MNSSRYVTRHVRSTTSADQQLPAPAPAEGARALVLGGGGSAGNAWVIGVLAGLADAGLAATDADLIIGTSSGSTAAAQIADAHPADLLTAILEAPPRPPGGPVGPQGGRRPAGPAINHLERTNAIIAAADGPVDMRRRLSAAALELEAESDGTWSARWRDIVAARLPGPAWPERALQIVAVDARTAEPVVFDRQSGIDLIDAVAASCSSGFPYGIGESRYLDGGYRRSSENADLAAGYGRVLVLSPFGGRSRAPEEWGMALAAQAEELRAGGSRVEAILPDGRSLEAFGDDMMDLSRRAPAARAGYDLGSALAGPLGEFWGVRTPSGSWSSPSAVSTKPSQPS
jgi:NTE family protein